MEKVSFNIIKSDKTSTYGLFVLLTAIILTLPWLGLGHFYTRGEPREALVAMAMMEQGNYILPQFQGEFAFKPPMLHWLVSLFSLPQGYVSEYTARMPSAIASIVLTAGFFFFYARRTSPLKAMIASLIFMSCFEVHRAAMTCRVDMVLTAFMAGAIIALYRWSENGYKGLPIIASLLISGAILTKGPIGAILPCFSLAVYMLICKQRISKIIIALIKVSILSSIIPLCWYTAAYQQGGDKFLKLVMEENFGRFLGKMTYESHEHGPLYNIPILLTGLLPYTLILLFGLFTVNFRNLKVGKFLWEKFRNMDRTRLFATIAAICIFVFYCIPKSKRSVYLLPMYPFLSLLIADYIVYLYNEKKRVLKIFSLAIASLAIIYTAGIFALHEIDLSILGTSRSARRIITQMSELQQLPINWYFIVFTALPAITAIALSAKMNRNRMLIFSGIFIWISMNITLDSILNPAIKNSVPDYRFAQQTKRLQPDCNVYFYRPANVAEETIYTVAFYLNDKLMTYSGNRALPATGYVIAREHNSDRLISELRNQGYKAEKMLQTDSEFTSFRGNLILYKFIKDHLND